MLRPIPLLDLGFLWIDRPETPANVGVLMLFDPPPGRTAAAAARQVVRTYRKARPGPPFDCVPDLPVLGVPHWKHAGPVDLSRHVLHEHLPAPGHAEDLHRFVARLHEAPLDRSRPLFSVHVIDGLACGQLAVYVKSHHASWDGRYALERIFGRLGLQPGPILPPFFASPTTRVPPPHPEPGATLAAGVRTLLGQASAVRELVGKLSVRSPPEGGVAGQRGNRPFAGPHTRFNEPVAAGRSYACFSLPLEEMRRMARACGGTLNDVALAVVDAGVERFLAELGERPRQPLVAMCPVSLRDPGDDEATTKAATLFVPLGRPRSGVANRLAQIVANTSAAKSEFRGFSREAALDYAVLAFGLWFASSTLGFGAVTRPVINLVVSNVGAVDGERYLGACRLAAAYPVSMLADPTGLNVTLVSVDGHMDFGIVANASAVEDAAALARSCEAAFERLRRATTKAASAGAERRAPRRRRTVSP
jgi:WS/DGAT/MGAT family acyltransferase